MDAGRPLQPLEAPLQVVHRSASEVRHRNSGGSRAHSFREWMIASTTSTTSSGTSPQRPAGPRGLRLGMRGAVGCLAGDVQEGVAAAVAWRTAVGRLGRDLAGSRDTLRVRYVRGRMARTGGGVQKRDWLAAIPRPLVPPGPAGRKPWPGFARRFRPGITLMLSLLRSLCAYDEDCRRLQFRIGGTARSPRSSEVWNHLRTRASCRGLWHLRHESQRDNSAYATPDGMRCA
jgi:hypothetical protein